ncbi:MAG: methionine synthase [Bacteroidales bacterium]|nr:methionine synthase [Bacteroidales bacterium]
MKNKIFQFDFKDLKLSVSQIENVIGFNEGDDREFVISLIDEVLAESSEIANVRAQYCLFERISFENESKSISINDITFNIKNIVYQQLKKSESVALFMCTAGEEIGKRSRKYMHERDLLRGYIYDVVGSEIAEAAADLMQDDLGKSASESGLKITNRYSPGYCGWNVNEQHSLFSLIPYNYCGIRLTESALMDPVKSVSGIIGIGSKVKSNPYTCRMCDMKDCIYRKVKERK